MRELVERSTPENSIVRLFYFNRLSSPKSPPPRPLPPLFYCAHDCSHTRTTMILVYACKSTVNRVYPRINIVKEEHGRPVIAGCIACPRPCPLYKMCTSERSPIRMISYIEHGFSHSRSTIVIIIKRRVKKGHV